MRVKYDGLVERAILARVARCEGDPRGAFNIVEQLALEGRLPEAQRLFEALEGDDLWPALYAAATEWNVVGGLMAARSAAAQALEG